MRTCKTVILLALLGGLLTGPLAGQTWQVDSGNLRLEVDGTSGYTYQLIDTANNKTLISQNQTLLSNSAVTGISGVSTTATGLTGTLNLAGGGTAQVQFEFSRPGVLSVSLNGAGASSIRERFVDNDERYYGVWEHGYENRNLDNDGLGFNISGVREPDGWNFSGDDDDIDKVYAASARAPFYMTNAGVGVYAETTARGSFEFDQSNTTGFKFQDSSLTYHVMAGDYKQILNSYNAISGPSFRPPDWSYGSIWWRDDHRVTPSYTGANNAQELVLRDAEILQDLQIPSTVMWIDRPYTTGDRGFGGDSFHPGEFPDPDQMVQELDARGMKLLTWIANWNKNELANAPETFSGSVDIRDPASEQYFKDYLDTLMADAQLADGTSGIFGYKIDRGGEGAIPDDLQNELVPLFQKMVAEQLAAQHGDQYFFFSRSVNDKSRKYTAHWNGDPDATWTGYEHSVLNGIRSGVINQPVWGSDTGGYKTTPGDELFMRWFGFSAYSPMMEIKFDLGRERDFYDDQDSQLVQVARKMVTEHHLMIPYVRSLMDENIRTGLAPMRAMFIEFPDDPAVEDLPDQYMYGSHLLIAPVVQQGATHRNVYLPAGEWIDYNDRQSRINSTGQTVNVDAPMDEVPSFVRAGAIIPKGDIVKGNNNWTANWQPYVDIEVYLPSKDEAQNQFDYYTGQSTKAIQLDKDDEAVVLRFDDLLVSGMLKVYLDGDTAGKLDDGTWKVFLDGQELGAAQYDIQNGLLTVGYSGDTELRLSAIPEPASVAVMSLAGATLLARKR